jgi:hypothetical protein
MLHAQRSATAPRATNAAQQKQQDTDRVMYFGLVMLVIVNVFFVVIYMFAHRNDSANNAARLEASKRVRMGMRDDPTERCKMTTSEYTVRNGRAALRPNRRSEHVDRCAGRSDPIAGKVVSNVNAQCPFMAVVYDSGSKLDKSKPFDFVSNSILVTGRWEPRESAIIEDLPADSLFVDVGANLGTYMYMCNCVCVCVRACVRARVLTRICICRVALAAGAGSGPHGHRL